MVDLVFLVEQRLVGLPRSIDDTDACLDSSETSTGFGYLARVSHAVGSTHDWNLFQIGSSSQHEVVSIHELLITNCEDCFGTTVTPM